jgi:hypothetical protein
MRRMLVVMTVFIGGGLLAGVAAEGASAAPLPHIAAASAVEPVGYWKHYCKYNDCTGAAGVDAEVTAPVVVPENPPVVAIVPVRPASCGEFKYWNGSACVDARYNKPYIGPR